MIKKGVNEVKEVGGFVGEGLTRSRVDGCGVGEVRKKEKRKTRGTAYLTVILPADHVKRLLLGEPGASSPRVDLHTVDQGLRPFLRIKGASRAANSSTVC